jgi:hypothetical protein
MAICQMKDGGMSRPADKVPGVHASVIPRQNLAARNALAVSMRVCSQHSHETLERSGNVVNTVLWAHCCQTMCNSIHLSSMLFSR